MEKEQLLKRLRKAVKKYEPGADEKMLKGFESQCIYEEVQVKGIRFKQLRDTLILLGTILEEDEKARVYVAVIQGGVFNNNSSIVVLKQQEDKVIIGAFAREGIIKQKTAIKAVGKIKSAFNRMNARE